MREEGEKNRYIPQMREGGSTRRQTKPQRMKHQLGRYCGHIVEENYSSCGQRTMHAPAKGASDERKEEKAGTKNGGRPETP